MDEAVAYRRKVHDQITDENLTPLQRYQDIVTGGRSLTHLLQYELTILLLGGLPGAVGLVGRRIFYRHLMQHVGRAPAFGRDIALRHPQKISIGDHFVADDDCVLDARGELNKGIRIGNNVMFARHVALSCKDGNINIGDHVGIGAYSIIHAVGRSDVFIDHDVVIGVQCYLGGTYYYYDQRDIPIARQGVDLRGGVRIGEGAWLGAKVTVLDGVTIGRGAIVGAGAVVTKDIPDFAIAVGIPAKVIGTRGE